MIRRSHRHWSARVLLASMQPAFRDLLFAPRELVAAGGQALLGHVARHFAAMQALACAPSGTEHGAVYGWHGVGFAY
eukprot:6676196-Alexandrium_andersonii.AAC.1